jgi:hypothetical protein
MKRICGDECICVGIDNYPFSYKHVSTLIPIQEAWMLVLFNSTNASRDPCNANLSTINSPPSYLQIQEVQNACKCRSLYDIVGIFIYHLILSISTFSDFLRLGSVVITLVTSSLIQPVVPDPLRRFSGGVVWGLSVLISRL